MGSVTDYYVNQDDPDVAVPKRLDDGFVPDGWVDHGMGFSLGEFIVAQIEHGVAPVRLVRGRHAGDRRIRHDGFIGGTEDVTEARTVYAKYVGS
mgnify:CR=1 FL=1